MIECIKSCYAIGPTKGDPFYINKGSKFEDYYVIEESQIECYSIRYAQSRFLFRKENFVNLSEVRNEKIEEIFTK